MVTLKNDRKELFQWDMGQSIVLLNEILPTEVHFQNINSTHALVAELVDNEAPIPNILLQEPFPIEIYLFYKNNNESHTIKRKTLTVIPRAQPADYIYTETEVFKYETVLAIAQRAAEDAADAKADAATAVADAATAVADAATAVADASSAVADASSAVQVAQGVRDDADAGVFKGDTGEQGAKGETGAKGDKGDKGDLGRPFIYEDFTSSQLEALVGPEGQKGDQGFKGDPGPKGDAFTYSDFTSEQLEGLQGPQGDRGDKGDPGEKGDPFEYEDFTLSQLETLKGLQGDVGPRGEQGEKGEDGVIFYPEVSSNGDLSWTNDKELPNPETVNLIGPKGDSGEKGDLGDSGVYFGSLEDAPESASIVVVPGGTDVPNGYMVTSVYDTNNNGIVDVAEKLPTYTTRESILDTVGQWIKIGDISLSGAWKSYIALLSIVSYAGHIEGNGVLEIKIQSGVTAETPDIKVLRWNYVAGRLQQTFSNFKLVYTPPLYEIWVNVSERYEKYDVIVLSQARTNATLMTYYSNQPFQATQPAGTVVSASMLKLNNDISGTADGNVSLLPASTPANLPLVSDASRGLQTKTAAEMRALLGAQPTMTPGTDYAIPAVDIAATLTAAGWASQQQTITDAAILATSPGDLRIAQSATDAEFEAWGKALPRVVAQAAGSITVRAAGEVPTINIPVEVEVCG